MSVSPSTIPAYIDAATASSPLRVVPDGTDLALLPDIIPHLVWTASADGEIDYVNTRTVEYTGIRGDELRGRPWGWLTLLHPDDVDGARRMCQDASPAGAEIRHDLRIRRADGEFRW